MQATIGVHKSALPMGRCANLRYQRILYWWYCYRYLSMVFRSPSSLMFVGDSTTYLYILIIFEMMVIISQSTLGFLIPQPLYPWKFQVELVRWQAQTADVFNTTNLCQFRSPKGFSGFFKPQLGIFMGFFFLDCIIIWGYSSWKLTLDWFTKGLNWPGKNWGWLWSSMTH